MSQFKTGFHPRRALSITKGFVASSSLRALRLMVLKGFNREGRQAGMILDLGRIYDKRFEHSHQL
jgi:hypothetical protein